MKLTSTPAHRVETGMKEEMRESGRRRKGLKESRLPSPSLLTPVLSAVPGRGHSTWEDLFLPTTRMGKGRQERRWPCGADSRAGRCLSVEARRERRQARSEDSVCRYADSRRRVESLEGSGSGGGESREDLDAFSRSSALSLLSLRFQPRSSDFKASVWSIRRYQQDMRCPEDAGHREDEPHATARR